MFTRASGLRTYLFFSKKLFLTAKFNCDCIVISVLISSEMSTGTYSVISTHTSRLWPEKFFTLDMRKLVKPVESDEKISFSLFTVEVEIFQLLWKFLAAKAIKFFLKSRGASTAIKFFVQNGHPSAWSSLRENRYHNYSQNKNAVLKVEINFLDRKSFFKEKWHQRQAKGVSGNQA